MDPFSQDVLSQPTGNRVAPEMLEMLGRKASQMFQQNGISLNQAIAQLSSQHPELRNEHIKRVVEFANNVTFQELFQNGADKNVHFEVADPGVIMRDLRDGGSPAHAGQTMNDDYRSSPKQSGMQDAEPLDHQIWPQGVDSGAGGAVKTASTHDIGYDDLYDASLQIKGVLNKLAESYELASNALESSKDAFYNTIKHEVANHDGAGLGGVLGALTKVASYDLVSSMLPGMVERLKEDGYHPRQLEVSLEKRAGAVVNPNHPLVTSFNEILKIAEEMVVLDEAISQTSKTLDEVTAVMKKEAGPLTSGVREAIRNNGKVLPALRQRFSRT